MKKIEKKNVEDIFALSPVQEGILFHYLKDPDTESYFEQLSLNISGRIDNKLFKMAWNLVVETNEMLRAVFRWENLKNPVQIILKDHNLQCRYYYFSGQDTSQKKEWLEEVKFKDRKEKFDLQEVPFRVTLSKVEKDEYELIISNHHILYDGWSNSIILREFFRNYNELCKGNRLTKPVKKKFKGFVRWIQNQDIKSQEKYWKDYLNGYNKETKLTWAKRQSTSKEMGYYHFEFSQEAKSKVYNFVTEFKITLATLLFSAWGILIQKYNNSKDVIFDTTVSGRSSKVQGIENIVGLFINTLPFRVKSHHGENIITLLYQILKNLRNMEVFESTSPLSIRDYYEIHKMEIFDSLLVLENYPLGNELVKDNIQLAVNSVSSYNSASYDVMIIIKIFNSIELSFTYNKDIFEKGAISKLCNHFIFVIETIINKPQAKVADIKIFSEPDRKKILDKLENKKILKAPKTISHEVKNRAPGSRIEQVLTMIWQDVLGITPFIEDDFFNIGGDSLALIRIYKRLSQKFPNKVKVHDLFSNRTIKQLAALIEQRNNPVTITETKKIRNIEF